MSRESARSPAVPEWWYRTAFEQMALPGVVLSGDSRLLAVNEAFADFVGQPGAQLLGRELGELCPNDALPLAASQCRELLAHGSTTSWEQSIRHAGSAAGSPVLVHATVLTDAGGARTAIAAVVQDLTLISEVKQALTAAQRMFDALATGATDWALVADADSNIRYVSGPLSDTGYTATNAVDTFGFDLVHPDDLEVLQARYEAMVRDGGTTGPLTFRIRTQDGGWRWIEQSFTNLLDDPVVAGVVCNGKDVTQRTEAQHALEASENRFRTIVETVQEGIWVVDATGHTVYANDKLAQILDLPLADIYASSAPDILDSEDRAYVAGKVSDRQLIGRERYDVEYGAGGPGRRVLHVVASPITLDDGSAGSVAAVTDVTSARSETDRLVDRALHDDVTGLANRVVLIDRLQRALARSARAVNAVPVAAIVIDLDQFSAVNDSCGYDAGDDVLAAVAHRLIEGCVDGASVARTAGDEFVVLIEDTDEAAALGVAEGLLAAVAEPFDIAGERVYLTASAGVAVAVAGSGTPENLLRRARAAMRQTQATNRGHVGMFDDRIAADAAQRLSLVSELREALTSDELQLHYQPIVELSTGRVTGVEALLRWAHPARGPISPAVFVPVAEQAGLASEIDDWVLRRAGRDYRAIAQALGAEATIAVNISASNLASSTIEQTISSALRSEGMPAHNLVLEITEGAVMHDPECARQVLGRLRRGGVTIALDDFGTGYSSLGYLVRLPVQRLKMDRLFVSNITADADALSLTSSIIEMGRALRMTVVAEGVETVEQLDLLRQLGCDAGQGFLWSPAVPVHELEALIGALPFHRFPVTPPARGGAQQPPRRYGRLRDVTSEHGLHMLVRMSRRDASSATIAAALNAAGYLSPRGTRWHHLAVTEVVNTLSAASASSPDVVPARA